MMRLRPDVVLCLLGTVAVASCGRKPVVPAAPETPIKTFAVTGIVMSLDLSENSARIQHQEIPGYMSAMTMPFTVKDTNELSGLMPGEEVTFRMRVTEDDMWIEGVKKTGMVTNLAPTTGHFRLVRDVEPLEVGDILPDYHFIDETGKAVRLSQWRGNALVLSFLFTRCPVPNFCPLTARKLVETQQELASDASYPTNWRILCITVDPQWDTPERLRQFGQAYGYDPRSWSFLTGELIDITAIGEQFGLVFWTEGETVSHNLRTVVVNANGLIQTNIIGNEWKVEELVADVIRAAREK